jgi:hypothetical protein
MFITVMSTTTISSAGRSRQGSASAGPGRYRWRWHQASHSPPLSLCLLRPRGGFVLPPAGSRRALRGSVAGRPAHRGQRRGLVTDEWAGSLLGGPVPSPRCAGPAADPPHSGHATRQSWRSTPASPWPTPSGAATTPSATSRPDQRDHARLRLVTRFLPHLSGHPVSVTHRRSPVDHRIPVTTSHLPGGEPEHALNGQVRS